ncbi:MAG: 2Fe-2S iron-sulfur cluster binding domain-containing protein [Hyphomicrobiales bacterium]|nr:2Fe-2S iron-sulfur cluster binding domain-containing protein [Hyphomicrobiales bacterium]
MSAKTEFHALPIASVRREAGGAIAVTFAIPSEKSALFAFEPGQHIAIRHMEGAEELRRNYSICAGPGEPLRIAIKSVDDGRFSRWACATLAPGMTLDVMPPTGRFTLPAPAESAPRRILLIAAGSGITPILGITRKALLDEPSTHVTLVYGNRSAEHAIFGEEIEDLKDRYLGRFEVIHVLSQDAATEMPLLQGRITGEKIRALAAGLIDPTLADHIFLCGPGTMIREVRDALFALGVAKSRVHHEFFAPGGGAYRAPARAAAPAAFPAGPAAELVAVLDGARHIIAMTKGETVLTAALRAGLKAPYSCTGGMCSTCRARIVEGAATMAVNYSLEPWEIEKGFVLTCQAVPTSAKLVVDYDAM